MYYIEVEENGYWVVKHETASDKAASSLVQHYRNQGKKVRLSCGNPATRRDVEEAIRESAYLSPN